MIEAKIFNRVKSLFAGDKRANISPFAFHASLFEEIGELAAALKVETGIVTHKTLDEAAKSEAVDVYICAALMYFQEGFEILDESRYDKFEYKSGILEVSGADWYIDKCDPFDLLTSMGKHFTKAIEAQYSDGQRYHWLQIANIATVMFFVMGGESREEFVAIGTKKLDKWSRNQAARNEKFSNAD